MNELSAGGIAQELDWQVLNSERQRSRPLRSRSGGLKAMPLRDRLRRIDFIHGGRLSLSLGHFVFSLVTRLGAYSGSSRSLMQRRHDVDPQLYFMQLLVNLSSWPASDLDAWLPDRWKQVHAGRSAALGIPAPPTT
jgi:hypothetical protein